MFKWSYQGKWQLPSWAFIATVLITFAYKAPESWTDKPWTTFGVAVLTVAMIEGLYQFKAKRGRRRL